MSRPSGTTLRRRTVGPYCRGVIEGAVFVIDRVVTRPGCARRFVDAYLTSYAPGARAVSYTHLTLPTNREV